MNVECQAGWVLLFDLYDKGKTLLEKATEANNIPSLFFPFYHPEWKIQNFKVLKFLASKKQLLKVECKETKLNMA